MKAAARRNFFAGTPEPTFGSETNRFVLKGHSGASIVLHSSGAGNFVRKTARDPSQNDRLFGQMGKQRRFLQIGLPFPRVLASGTDDFGSAYFDMAYIPGRTVADAVANAASFDAQAVLGAVEKTLWLFRSCGEAVIPPESFRAKIGAIAESASLRAAGRTTILHAIRDCSARLLHLDWGGVPSSLSHGDLTLENIILGPDHSIAFIDCDDAWVSSYWLDMGKLFQDFYGHWCLRELYVNTEASIAVCNAVGKLEQMAASFRSLIARYAPELDERLGQLAALNLFRALPYAVQPRIALFICRRIQSVLQS